MFQGDAQAALDLYSSVFDDLKVRDIERYAEGEGVPAGSFKLANVTLAGHELVVFDSPPVHEFTFTPSISIFVDFDSVDEADAAFAKLSDGGQVMMPLDDYGFSARFAWVADRFGVSWQLNVPAT